MSPRPRGGGSANQAGINFQNHIAILRIADMLAEKELDNPLFGRLGRIDYVRNEHPSKSVKVDDTVVKYSMGRTEYFQAKSDISRNGAAWKEMWKHFYDQFQSSDFERGTGKDFITLVVNYSEPLRELETALGRAVRAASYDEWYNHHLTNTGRGWADNIRDVLSKEYKLIVPDQEFFELCQHVRVSLSTYEFDPQDSRSFASTVYETLKDKFTPASGIFMILAGVISSEAPGGGMLTNEYLIRKLQDNGVQILKRSRIALGDCAYLMCDRNPQETQFNATFHDHLTDKREASPQIYLIPGPLGENHNSLVRRFYYTVVEDYVKCKPGILFKEVEDDWPASPDLSQRKNVLRVQLFKQFDLNYQRKTFEEMNATTFRRIIISLQPSFIVIRHQIREWDEQTHELIQWYKEFWNDVKGNTRIPPCLIFLNVSYTPKQLKRVGKLSNSAIPRGVNPILNLLPDFQGSAANSPAPSSRSSNCFCFSLSELPCVKPEHVEIWFDRFKIRGPGLDPKQEIRKIFQTPTGRLSACKQMSEVEDELQNICRRFIEG